MRHLMRSSLAMAGALMLTSAALAQQPATPAPRTGMPATMDHAMMTPERFAMAAAMGDKFEIESSQLALERSRRNEVTNFARMMVADHTKSTDALIAAAREDKVALTPPDKLDEKHMTMVTRLRDAQATNFDRAYIDAQVMAHREAVDMMRTYSQNGPQGAIKAFAQQHLPIIEGHLRQAEGLQRSIVIGAR